MERQNRKYVQKKDSVLAKQSNDGFNFHSVWNPNAPGGVLIPLLLLGSCVATANAEIQSRSTSNNRAHTHTPAKTETCPAVPYNATSMGTNDYVSKPFQPLSTTTLSTSKSLNMNDLGYHMQAGEIRAAGKKITTESDRILVAHSQVHTSQHLDETPELADNSKAISDLTKCYWNSNGTKIIDKDRNCPKSVLDNMPDYSNLKIWEEWYKDVQYFPGGRAKHLLTAVTRHSRKGVPANTSIIILTSSLVHHWYAQDLLSYCERFSILNSYKGRPIVGFYPELFGTYIGNFFPVEMIPLHNKHGIAVHVARSAQNIRMSYVEMEYFDKVVDHEVYYKNYPDNVVFERDLSNWASRKIVKCVQGDSGPRHDLLVNVSYYRAYHIGNETYLFNPGPMPKMIDLDTVRCEAFSERYESRYRPNSVQSQEAKKVVSEMGEKGIFNVFSMYFSKYKFSDQNQLPGDAEVKHYHIPDEYLGRM